MLSSNVLSPLIIATDNSINRGIPIINDQIDRLNPLKKYCSIISEITMIATNNNILVTTMTLLIVAHISCESLISSGFSRPANRSAIDLPAMLLC